eukprot:CAMPEP_0119079918 /NCGR_PEP_ID=MMETSP1178-20130426/109706_1 /TAXON_ID=33656 /ORGANISM="unid sp, Strain CCMP2000" /LENGTH=244 /DNA_ID=CAMNT_0007062473 /DNA_START=62 /DNA_END=792 /DNA_ORIENTATION=+
MACGKCSVWIDAETINLAFSSPSGQRINSSRKPNEMLAVCLKRVAISVSKAENKNKGAGKDALSAWLVWPGGESACPDDLPNHTAFRDGSTLHVSVVSAGGDAPVHSWLVERDAPFVASLVLPELPLVGFPVVAHAELRFASGATWEWSQGSAAGGKEITLSRLTVARGSRGELAWRHSHSFVPTAAEAGCVLSVRVTPQRRAHAEQEQQQQEEAAAAAVASCPHRVLSVAPAAFSPMKARHAL